MNIVRFMPVVMTLWTRVFELSVIIAAMLSMFCLGIAINWLTDRGPLFIENPDPAARAYADPRAVQAGETVTLHRMIRRLKFCPINAAVWLVEDKTFLHVDSYFAFAQPTNDYRDFRIIFQIPSFAPPGHYRLRTYVQCQRNPLVDITQLLTDVPIDVLPAK
jgi:hypothetical protein